MEVRSKVIYTYGLILVLIFTLGLGQLALAPAIQAAGTKERRITITDSTGRLVRVPCPPRRIISVNGNASELICAFGAGEKIVGISDTTDFPPLLKDKAKVGKVMTPSIEKIAALKPDLFIAYGSGMALKQEIVSKLQKLGIPVVLLDCYKLETMGRDVRTLGKILAREKEAEEYLAFFEKYQRLIESRTEKLPAKMKPLVYLELFSDYKTVSAGAGGAQMLEAAGGRNAAGDFRVPYPQVSPEWVLAKNPQVIIHVASTSSLPSGFGKSPEALKKKRTEIISRPAWRSIKAVQAGKVYLLSSEIYTGPRGIVGIAYFAKWLHPGLFPDIDPEAIHRELLKKFHGLELKGAWVYP